MEKPSSKEEEYFARQELEKRRQWERERAAKMALEEREKLKELHFMKCPKCGMDLTELEYQGITLDRCVTCNGTWFDAGEMEQLLKEQGRGLLGKVMGVFG